MFEIYGRKNCVWCDRAKDLLKREGFSFTYHDIEEDKKALSEFKFYFKDAQKVPQIMVEDDIPFSAGGGGYFIIGGFEDLRKWLKEHYTRA